MEKARRCERPLGSHRRLAQADAMKVFLDFEASSLGDRSYPIEVAWVFEDGHGESHLIAPAPGWTDWDARAEAIHGISQTVLAADGEPHAVVAQRMLAVLADHQLFASAPSWDGKWLSVLLRAAGLPRHALRLRDTDEAVRETAATILAGAYDGPQLDRAVEEVVAQAITGAGGPPAHPALADARGEQAKWARARDAALTAAGEGTPLIG